MTTTVTTLRSICFLCNAMMALNIYQFNKQLADCVSNAVATVVVARLQLGCKLADDELCPPVAERFDGELLCNS